MVQEASPKLTQMVNQAIAAEQYIWKPDQISMGGNGAQMLKSDTRAEEEAILQYKNIIKQPDSEGDETTRRPLTGSIFSKKGIMVRKQASLDKKLSGSVR